MCFFTNESETLFYHRCFSTTTNTVDKSEIQQFQQFTTEWWDEFGPMKPLHSMNKLRVPFIRDGLINRNAIGKEQINTSTPLKGISILDVGCGGKILFKKIILTEIRIA